MTRIGERRSGSRPPAALLLGAGLGTRLGEVTARIPKCLVPVGGRPIVEHWILELARAGVPTMHLNTHAHRDQAAAFIDRVNQRGGIHVAEFHEPELLGSAGTLTALRRLGDETDEIILIYADNLSEVDLAKMLAFHRAHSDPVTMLLFRTDAPRECGIATLDEDHRVIAFTEKPEHPVSNLANAGVYIVDAAAFREMADLRAFDLGFDVLPRFVNRMRGHVLDGVHLDIGTPDRLAAAEAAIEAVHERRGWRADGMRPAIFLDRDGTLIESVHYLSDPDGVRLIPEATAALLAARTMGHALVLVTNQSAIGRGMLDADRLEEIHTRLRAELASEGLTLDQIEWCPEVPQSSDRTVVDHPDRKPGPGMLLRATEELGLDLDRSWMIGDMISDVLAGENAGVRHSVLLPENEHQAVDTPSDHPQVTVESWPGLSRRWLHGDAPHE